jgi:hypothetical protein
VTREDRRVEARQLGVPLRDLHHRLGAEGDGQPPTPFRNGLNTGPSVICAVPSHARTASAAFNRLPFGTGLTWPAPSWSVFERPP